MKQLCTPREWNPGNSLLTNRICLKYFYQWEGCQIEQHWVQNMSAQNPTVEFHKHNIPKNVDNNCFSKLKGLFSKSFGGHIVAPFLATSFIFNFLCKVLARLDNIDFWHFIRALLLNQKIKKH